MTSYLMSTFFHPKAVYKTGTKKQKMDMSKAIVESIYSMEPPGRFLKQCPGETGEWKELSRREAADRVAQAMAYAIKGESLKEKRRERRRLRLPPSLRLQQDDVDEKSSQGDGRPTNNHWKVFVHRLWHVMELQQQAEIIMQSLK
jgi:hypothetical protein